MNLPTHGKIPALVITVLFAITRNGHSVHWSKPFQNFSVFLNTSHIIQIFCITFEPVKSPSVVGGGAGWYGVPVCVGTCTQFCDTASYERLDSTFHTLASRSQFLCKTLRPGVKRRWWRHDLLYVDFISISSRQFHFVINHRHIFVQVRRYRESKSHVHKKDPIKIYISNYAFRYKVY